MSRRLPILAAALVLFAAASAGCVDRRFVIESDPPGAMVYVNNRPVGATPVDQSFTYYGKYRFVFVRDGYETLTVDECIRTPWWSYFPLEFVVESLLPYNLRDVRYIRRPLEPRQEISEKVILDRAQQLRSQAATLGPPDGAVIMPGAPAPAIAPQPVPQLPPAAGPGTPVPVVPQGLPPQ
jgi:hypothetical protein